MINKPITKKRRCRKETHWKYNLTTFKSANIDRMNALPKWI